VKETGCRQIVDRPADRSSGEPGIDLTRQFLDGEPAGVLIE
jgi:hypothetical protein